MATFYFFVFLTVVGLFIYILQVISIRSVIRSKGKKSLSDINSFLPPISIIKPMKGLDDNLFDNLESFCCQNYPVYEIIFTLQDYNDPAYKVAKKVKDKYPDVDISIVVEKCDDSLNPKVKNLITGYRASKYQYILISDSNVMVRSDYLRSIVEEIKSSQVALVSNVIRGTRERTLGSIMENLHLNSFILGSVCFLDRFLKMPCVIGKSMLVRKDDLKAIGGFEAVKDILAEDYMIGNSLHRMGKRVVLSNYLIDNVNENWDIKKFINRHTRWGKLRFKLAGAKYFVELLCNPVFISIMPLILWDISVFTLFLTISTMLVKVGGDFYIGRLIKSNTKPFLYLLSPLKDILIGLIWFIPLFDNKIDWRGNKYKIGFNTKLSPLTDPTIYTWKYRLINSIKARFA